MPGSRSFHRAFWCVVFCVLWSGLGHDASAEQPLNPAQEIKLQLEVLVNGRSKGVIVPFTVQANGGLVAKASDLRAVGLKLPDDPEPETLIELDKLAGLRSVYDEPRQAINLIVPDNLLLPAILDGRGDIAFEKPRSSDFGLLVNYLAYASGDASGRSNVLSNRSLYLDGRFLSPVGTLRQSGFIGQTLSNAAETTRLDTTFSYTDVDLATTFQAGDVISVGAPWARPIRLFGLQGASNYGVRPDIVTAAIPSIDGSAAAPTTLDVYVNNVKTYSRDLPIGPYSLQNIPGLYGSGQAEIVTRDATGREVRSRLPFFATSSLLRPGIIEFGAQLGFARYYYAVSNFTYGDKPLGVATLRGGVTDGLTLQAHAEGGAGLTNLGGGASFNFFNFGTMTLAGQGSSYENKTGFLPYLSFETTLGAYRLSGSTQRTVGDYEDLVSATARPAAASGSFGFWQWDRPQDILTWTEADARRARPARAVDRISIGTRGPFDNSQIGINLASVEREQEEPSRIVSAFYSQNLTRTLSLSVNAFADLGENPSQLVSIGVYGTFEDFSVSSTASLDRNGGDGRFSLFKGGGNEPGAVTLRADVASDRNSAVKGYASAGYTSTYARLGASTDISNGRNWVSTEIEGSIAAIGTSVVLGRRVDDAFAIVNVGRAGIPVQHQNRVVGTSDFLGNVLVPSLTPYQTNTVSVDVNTLPTDMFLTKTDERVVPASGSGVKLNFVSGQSGQSGRAALVSLVDGAGAPLGVGLSGTVERTGEAVIVGQDGQIWSTALSDADRIIINLNDASCTARIQLGDAPKKGFIETVGPFTCQ